MQTFVEIGSAVRKIFPDKKKTDRKLKSSRTANAGRSTNNSLISLSILFNFFNFFPTLVFRGLKKIIIIIIIIYQLYVSRILSLLCCIIEYHSNVCHLTVTVNQSINQLDSRVLTVKINDLIDARAMFALKLNVICVYQVCCKIFHESDWGCN